MKHQPILPHFCNEPLRCPACVHRFWVWAEMHTQGRKPKVGDKGPRKGLAFYEAAAKIFA